MDKLRDLHALQPLGDASQRGLFLGRLYLCFWALLGCLSFVCCEADEPRLPRAKLSLTVYLEPVDEAWLNSAQPILSFSPQRGREAIFPLEKLPISEGRIQLTLERPWDGSLTVQLSTLQAELTEVAVEPRTSRLRRTRSLVFEAHSLRSYRYRAYEDAPPSVMVLNPLSFLQSQGQGPASERWDERMLFGDTLWWPLEGQPWTKAYTALFEAWQLMAKSWTGDSSQPLGATASWELLDHVEHLIDRQDENGLNALEINLGAALREALHHMPLTVESAQLLLRLPCSFTSLGHEQDSRELWTCPSIKALPPYLAYLSPVEGLSSASQRPTDIEILVYGLSGASVSSVGGDWILKSERHPLIVREAEPPTAFEPMTFSPKLGFEIPLHRAQFSLSWAEVNRPTVAVLVSAKDENDQREELGLNLPFISPPSTDLMGVISLLKPLPRQVITAMPLSSLWRSDDVMWTTESDEDGRFTLSIAGYKGALYLTAQRDDGRVSMIVNLPSFTLQEPSLIGVWLSPLSTLISWVTFTQADSQNDWTHALQTALWLRGVADFIMEEKSEINLGHWEDEEARLTRGRTYQNHLLETIARRSPCQAYALEAADQPEDQLYRPWTLFDLDPADISHHPEEALKRWGIWLIEGCFLHSVEGEESLSLAPLITAGILARDTASSDDSLSSQLTPALSVSRDSGSWAKEQGKSRWWFNGSELRITLSFWLGWTELALFQRSGLESVEVNIRPPLASDYHYQMVS